MTGPFRIRPIEDRTARIEAEWPQHMPTLETWTAAILLIGVILCCLVAVPFYALCRGVGGVVMGLHDGAVVCAKSIRYWWELFKGEGDGR